VKEAAAKSGLSGLAPHDLRRTCARLCHQAGGELEQIQFLLGHVSIETTERYLGCKQRFRNAVNDKIGLEPDGSLGPKLVPNPDFRRPNPRLDDAI
jgi:integrase